jgi:hypothetical protein
MIGLDKTAVALVYIEMHWFSKITDFLAYQEDDEATLEANEALITEAERRSSLLSKERANYQCKSS